MRGAIWLGCAAAVLTAPSAALAAGELDPSFGSGGVVRTPLAGASTARISDVAVQRDGRIVVVGAATTPFGAFVVARYLRDGALDPSFGSGGVATVPLPGGFGGAVALRRDGRIVAGGCTGPRGGGDDGPTAFALAQLRADGTLDPAFGGGDGVQTTARGDKEACIGELRLLPGGRVLAGGTEQFDFDEPSSMVFARYRADGALDRSFRGGAFSVHIGAEIDSSALHALLPLRRGRVLAVGGGGFDAVRLLPNGRLDRRFGRRGIATFHHPGPDFDSGPAVAAFADRRGVLLAGSQWVARDGNFARARHELALLRMRHDGRVDRSFGRRGWRRIRIALEATDALRDSRGRLILLGRRVQPNSLGIGFGVVRLRGGRLDRSFGRGGLTLTPLGDDARPTALALQRGAGILAGGTDGAAFALARYRP